jgi:Clr5 domain
MIKLYLTENRAHKFSIAFYYYTTPLSYTMAARGGGRPKIDFKQYKDIIYNLYIVDHQPLEDVQRYIKSCYNFELRYI